MRAAIYLSLIFGLSVASPAAEKIDFVLEIKPLLTHKCGACHGALEQEAGLRVDAGVLVHRGSDSGDVIVPGQPAESLLIERVSEEDPDLRMPPEGEGAPFNAEQIRLLSEWIRGGALFPDDEHIPSDPTQHWAYQIPTRPALPPIDDGRWSNPIDAFVAAEHERLGLASVDLADRYMLLRRVYLNLIGLPPTRTQIDEFVEDESPDAWTRLVERLLESPHYGERWGRHWMDVWRYSDWDGYKQQLRGSQRHIWRWREWIVQSLNDDKGYDRMVAEMLAGDEIAPGDPSILPATGFLARNYHKSNRNIWLDATVEHTAKAFLGTTLNCARCHDHKYDPIAQAEYFRFRAIFEPHNVRTDRLPGQPNLMQDGLPRVFDAEPSAETFLYRGGNEKHPDKDHPMTPAVPAVLGGMFEVQPVELPLLEYYPALKGFAAREDLAKARRQLGAANTKLTTHRQASDSVRDTQLNPPSGRVERGSGRGGPSAPALSGPESPTLPEGECCQTTKWLSDDRLLELKHAVAESLVKSLQARQAADVAKYGSAESPADENRKRELAIAAAQAERQLAAHQAELTLLEKRATLDSAETSDEKDEKKKQSAIEAAKKGVAEAEMKLDDARNSLDKTDGKYKRLGEEYPRESTGRRLALARWIASTGNPLTARVAVNHIWMRHFGNPLVGNVFDFGLRTPRPAHADLLDWLAVELMENGWSMKHLHRLIVTSHAWRLASSSGSSADSTNLAIDPDNHYLWRSNARRIDAEIIRDCVLAVSGQLDRTLGGADIDYQQGESTRRRSVYLRHAYEKQMTMLVLFDAASPNECYRRSESIIPQQALALANSSLTLGLSRLLARDLWSELEGAGEDRGQQFIEQAYRQILSRPPLDEELAACLRFLAEQADLLSDLSQLTTFTGGVEPSIEPADDPVGRARENLVHVLVNHNDFVTVR
jgi:hypothetical protein